MTPEQENIQAAMAKISLHEGRRHILLCTGPRCCTPEEGEAAWSALKQNLREAGLNSGPNTCQRTKVGCLRICTSGPTVLVYPEGTWYHGMKADVVPRFVQEHLVDGKPVEELVFAEHPLQAK